MMNEFLGTMQQHALSQRFGRKDFSAQEVAELDYQIVAKLPKIGRKGIAAIRAWLSTYGLDPQNLPVDDGQQMERRLRARLQGATRLLQKYGYRVEPPR